MKIIKIIAILIIMLLLWIFKPIIMLYFNKDIETNNTIYTTPINDELTEENFTIYPSSYEKQLYRHKSSKVENSNYKKLLEQHKVSNKINHIRGRKKSILPKFKCDGRKYCSQMHSYDEAKYFIRYCPNTKMDGDHDGIPCERQFGRH